MRDEPFNAVLTVSLLLLICVVGGFMADCSYGKTEVAQDVVTGKQYTAAYTTTQFVTDIDSKGHICGGHTTTTYHPEVFRLFTRNGNELDVTGAQYHAAKEGQNILVQRQVGRWTGFSYGWNLKDLNGNGEW